MSEVRREVSAIIRHRVPYQASFTRQGGVVMDGIRPDTLAFRMGLRNGDRVEAIGGVQIDSSDAAMNAYVSLYLAKKADIILVREGRRITLQYKLVS
jgi:S1-C subfamily serine protease